MEKKKPFFFRIESAELLNFATDPDGEKMSLLRFAKELQKGKSDIEFIQSIIDEAHNYIETKKKAGRKGGLAKASTAKALPSTALANPSTPLARSSSSNRSKYKGDFESAWNLYPNKTGKTKALQHFKSTVRCKEDEDNLLSAMKGYIKHLEVETWKKPQNGSTWFNQWKDWVGYEHSEQGGELTPQQRQLQKTGTVY